jgi:exodeoxyribonuclease-3
MRLLSWNVNGIRAAARHGFSEWLAASMPDILCLQETRVHPNQLDSSLLNPSGYAAFWHSAHQMGYSGVATFCREVPQAVQHGLGLPEYDSEGRVLISEHSHFTLINAYFPSGRRGQERISYKLSFYTTLLSTCLALCAQGRSLVVCGDLNTAHQPIDLARPKENRDTSGFLPEERQALGVWLQSGFVDIFRYLHPETVAYTWWSNLHNARARNIGWRIDYFLITEDLLTRVVDARILPDVAGSDHCPIELILDLS